MPDGVTMVDITSPSVYLEGSQCGEHMRFIGDIHGKLESYFPIAMGADESVQIGDFGIGFQDDWGAWQDDRAKAFFENNPGHKFIRGNHDNPSVCATMPGWLPDGSYDAVKDIMYIGGALSIDRGDRLIGVDWWENEELGVEDFERIFEDYARIKPSAVVTHDVPHNIAGEMFFGPLSNYKCQTRTRTGSYLQMMFEEHAPDLWIFGHWHETRHHKHGTTDFVCLGELVYIDL
jgi:predicted phosphohydrolase